MVLKQNNLEIISPQELQNRREFVFLCLSAVFLASMTLLNVIGITKFVNIGPLTVAVGVLPYPLTFLCTDIVSELFGQKKSNQLVMVGFFVNLFVLFILFLGELFPSATESAPPWQTLYLSQPVYMADGSQASGQVEMFELIFSSSIAAIFASMVAYVLAQFWDVQVFHYFKRLTKGKHLWMRNNFSTMSSQLIDTVAVIGITFGASYFRGDITSEALWALFAGNYAFKFVAAALDTGPFYYLVGKLSNYLQIDIEKIEED